MLHDHLIIVVNPLI